MTPKFEHLMDEADIGSGEKTPTEIDDLEETKHLREQQEEARQQPRPMDGGQLQQVVEEQKYINQHESHTPHSVMDPVSSDEEGLQEKDTQATPNMPPKSANQTRQSPGSQGQSRQ